MDIRRDLFSFDGRLRRRDWWLWSIALGVAFYAVSDISAALLRLDGYIFSRGGREAVIGDPWLPLAHNIILSLMLLWPQAALAVRRAHDRAGAAWPVLLATVVIPALSFWPVETYTEGGRALDNGDLLGGAGLIAGIVTLALSLYLLVVLGFLDGTPGPNRFGRSPKGLGGDPAETAAEVFS